MNIWSNLFILLTSPSNGWRLIGKYNIPKDYLFEKLFGPLLGIISISSFAIYIYEPEYTLIDLLQRAVAQAGIFYFGYMISTFILITLNQREAKQDRDFDTRINIFCIYCYSLLMIFTFVENLIPPNLVDLFRILPLYVAIVIWKAKEYIPTNIKESKFVIIYALSVMLPYFFISYILNSIL